MNGTVALLAASQGLGGGIERYVSTIESALQEHEVSYRRIDLLGVDRPSGIRAKLRFLRRTRHLVKASREPVHLILAHGNLLPVVPLVARLPAFGGATVILYGSEIWTRRRVRGHSIIRRPDVHVVTCSNFSAGALATTAQASVLNPGVSPAWFDALVTASTLPRPPSNHVNLVTAFRLGDWRDKGLATLLEAIRLLDDERIRLTVCGTGSIQPELAAAVAPHPWCVIAANLTDEELAAQFGRADVFVLATRTRFGRRASGEGFGLVLLEAQLAGTPVIAPAYGGGGDAFQPGLTGLAPVDESAESLAAVLAHLLDDERRTGMGRAAALWARARFEPAAHSAQVIATLLGSRPGHPPRPAAPDPLREPVMSGSPSSTAKAT
jgi:glycosyltransferase involved in cell wall biosynthesis